MLTRVRVLDLTDERGALAGKILADLGADVVRVEPPGGAPTRAHPPFLAGEAGSERSLRWLALEAGKRGIALDLEEARGALRFRALARAADVVIESFAPGAMAALGLGDSALRAENTGLVYCAITPFGQTGPYAHHVAHDLCVVAMGGNLSMTGEPDGPPLRCSQPTSHFHAAPEAALGILMALYARNTSGRGQFVDVSMQECQLGTLLSGAGQYGLSGRLGRRSGGSLGRTREIWSAKDGQVSFGLRGGPARIPNLVATVEYMAESGWAPDWLRAFDWKDYSPVSASDEELARLEDAFAAFFETKSMNELYTEALARRILLAPCNDARAILAQEQLRSRGLFERIAYPHLGVEIEHPAFFARASRSKIGIARRAPRFDEHSEEIEKEWLGDKRWPGAAPVPTPRASSSPKRAERAPIFAGLKVLELGAGAAGPVATRYFAEHGATVIRIESGVRPDFLRTLHVTASNRNEPDVLERSPMFVLLNPNKQSLTLNLKQPEALAIAKKLVAWSDVVSENFAPGVMQRWGLDWPALSLINPRLVMVSGCLFGQTGPQRAYPGFGGQGSAIAGFNHLTGRLDGPAHGPYATITDSLAPRYVATAITAALLERERSGKGQYIDVSQIETGVYSLSETIVRFSANGEIERRRGNRHEFTAPHGVYPCSGEDRWVAIACGSEAEWGRLVDALGGPAWALGKRFANVAGRLAHEDELDEHLAAHTRTREPRAWMELLQRAGVEACAVQDFEDLSRDPQLEAREHFVTLEHAHLGPLRFERAGFRLAEHPGSLIRPGPTLGEHNALVLEEILGLSQVEIAALIDSGSLA